MSNAKVRHRRRRRTERRQPTEDELQRRTWDQEDEYVPWDWYTMTDGYGSGHHSGFEGQGEG